MNQASSSQPAPGQQVLEPDPLRTRGRSRNPEVPFCRNLDTPSSKRNRNIAQTVGFTKRPFL